MRQITINSISGGRTSSYMAIHYPADYNVFALVCIDDPKASHKDAKVTQMINDRLEKSGSLAKYGEFIASAEFDETINVLLDLEDELGKEITWIRGRSFDQIINQKRALPNLMMRFCTTEMKILPIAEWVIDNLAYPVYMNVGIRLDEFERAKNGDALHYRNKIQVGYHPSGNRKWQEYYWAVGQYPLIEDRIGVAEVNSYWNGKPAFLFPSDSNCAGCFWKSAQQLRHNFEHDPSKIQWFMDQESKRKRRFKKSMSYSSIPRIALQQDFFSGEGAGCQEGFCTD